MEIIPKPKKVPILERIFSLVLGLILIFFVFSFTFVFLSQKKLSLIKTNLERERDSMKSPEIVELENEIKSAKEKIKIFKDLINNYYFPSKFFPILESKILKEITLTRASFKFSEGKVSIAGEANNFQSLAKQINVLKNSKEFSDLKISKISLSKEGKLSFEISFSFNKEFLK